MDTWEVLVAAALSTSAVYGILWIEARIRAAAVRARGPKPDTIVDPDIKEESRISGAAVGVRCGNPRHHGMGKVTDYVLYADGDMWCFICDAIEEDR